MFCYSNKKKQYNSSNEKQHAVNETCEDDIEILQEDKTENQETNSGTDQNFPNSSDIIWLRGATRIVNQVRNLLL